MDWKSIAEEAARESALISGFDPQKHDEQFNLHCRILRDILSCTTGALTHPLIINMDLCGHRERAQYRRGTRAAEAEYLPDARYVRTLLLMWWFGVQRDIVRVMRWDEERQRAWVWDQHDFIISLEPFKSANGRTARAVYYMLITALRLSPHIITAEKATVYYAHKREYREKTFAPLMRAHGYIS